MSDPIGLPAPSVIPETLSLDALRAGDRAEFSRLVEVYSGKLYRLALKMLNHPQDAEDILQETFLKAFRHIKNFDGRASISTWLYRIVTNEALMLLRRKNPETISIDEPDESADTQNQEPLQIIDWSFIPETELLNGEARNYLDQAISRLPASLRAAFLLRDIENLSTQEASDVLGLTETALKTRLSRARLHLREDLSAYYAERMDRKTYGAF